MSPIISFALSATVSLLCVVATVIVARFAIRAAASLPPKACSCASQLESLSASLQETQDALTLVANRVKMQRVRNAATHTDPSNIPATDPVSIKAELRRRAGLVAGKPANHS